MLQKKPLHKWTSQDLRKWRERLSNLILLAYETSEKTKARNIIEDYKKGKLTYREAEKKLKELASKTKAKA
ncbi:MAG: hypothetical protein GSR81_07255 [Desulfurococcales archaeon]|nr:hypothetical protein [Desulfurococcales archaeon]